MFRRSVRVALATPLAWCVLGSPSVGLAEDSAPTEPKRSAAFERADLDGDGSLSAEERRKADQALRLDRFDLDRDGTLNEDENRAALEADARAAKQREKRRQRFDRDGDGVVTDDEVAKARMERRKNRSEAVRLYDTDGDGRLSEAEREAIRIKRGSGAAARGQRGDAAGGAPAGSGGENTP